MPLLRHREPGRVEVLQECATPLSAPARAVAEERKVVTALFCDLVGFTATSESADPEDVDQMLSAYAAMARTQIEATAASSRSSSATRSSGSSACPPPTRTTPSARCAPASGSSRTPRSLEAVGGAPLRLRVGINTGETLVRLGVTPGSGERLLAGDAINTASRIQSVAPEMGVAVGLGTYEATSLVFDYEELEPATLKGKSEPVRVFHAKNPARAVRHRPHPHPRHPVHRSRDRPRAAEGHLRQDAWPRPRRSSSPWSASPASARAGSSPSSARYIDAKPDLITWRQGRCLPYGEGITFWALGEIVKAHAGILESDAPDVATTKLDVVLPEGEERPWFRQRLLPLLGIEATSTAEREELFTAWRRFLEHIAEQDPTVLVFEDLHWADDAMLAFLEHLADRAEARPAARSSAPPDPSCSSVTPTTRRLRNATPINLVAALGGGDRAARLRAARDDRDPRRAAAADPRACRWQPPLRRGVRAPAARTRTCSSRRARAGSCARAPRSRSPTRSRP